MSQLIIAKTAGFCFGVQRSIDIAESKIAENPCYCFGELIHNHSAMQSLEEKGLRTINAVEELPMGETVLIRAHGVPEKTFNQLVSRAGSVEDATCPFVKKIHRIVSKASQAERKVVVIGDANHPEVIGICGWCKESYVFSDAESFLQKGVEDSNFSSEPITLVFQTTQLRSNFDLIQNKAKKLYTNLEIFDTICFATSERQEQALSISKRVDAMVVIGEMHSANSRHLAQLCQENCPLVIFVDKAEHLDVSQLQNKNLIGITAGASVPAWIIKEVVNKMTDEIKVEKTIVEEVASPAEKAVSQIAEAAEKASTTVKKAASKVKEAVDNIVEDGMSFKELLEANIRTVKNGDIVEGVVMSITPTEVLIDLGTKQSAFINAAEFTNDGEKKINEIVKVGDVVKAYVVRVNDVDGTAQLSKRRLDAQKSWTDLEEAVSDSKIMEGVVTEDNKGGIVVKVLGQRVFVPASQTGLPRETDMKTLVGQSVRLKINEVNRARKRVVGSIKAVANKERKELSEKVWNEIEVGKHYLGTVKSMTNYGAFVDIGGVDGMVHVSEISWGRVNKPEEVLKIGDQIDVYVINFDKDAHRISLGHRDPDNNPWNKFIEAYNVDDVVKVKVVKLMPFGAFAEVMPGVDGLIHISQIANHRITAASEVLNVGDEVEAKITNIDTDKKKISLSIRALTAPEAESEAPAEETQEE